MPPLSGLSGIVGDGAGLPTGGDSRPLSKVFQLQRRSYRHDVQRFPSEADAMRKHHAKPIGLGMFGSSMVAS